MQLQQFLLKKYQEAFPGQTLREISARTGIQPTRVFRIFNGYEMKLTEYEKFREAMIAHDPDFSVESGFTVLGNIRKLTPEQINSVAREVNYMLMHNSFSRGRQC